MRLVAYAIHWAHHHTLCVSQLELVCKHTLTRTHIVASTLLTGTRARRALTRESICDSQARAPQLVLCGVVFAITDSIKSNLRIVERANWCAAHTIRQSSLASFASL